MARIKLVFSPLLIKKCMGIETLLKRNILGSTHAAYGLNEALILENTSAIDKKLQYIGERN